MTNSTAAIPVILDVDTGVDDALAILFAVKHPGINVLGISCVAGNASLDRVVENTLRVLDVADAPSIPVAAGARRPLLEPARSASHVHGESGLGTLQLPPTDRTAESISSIELMRRLILDSPRPVTLVGLAPQTNLALLLRQYPDLVKNIERIVFMGGSTTVGNATAVAEFNVWHDPEAAAIVLDSGVPTFMYGLDVFNQVAIGEQVALSLVRSESNLAQVVGRLLSNRIALGSGRNAEYTGLIGDAGAICALVDPGALTTQMLPLRVQLAGYGRGQTLVDKRTHPGEDIMHGLAGDWEVAEVALDVDVDRYARLFLDTLGLGSALPQPA
ncbi:nucleoside hydrolase [Cryobacterium levicorallinum]|uniref:Nucleoside hydrolase n=1 Tax=Cryobacterium levicorallinum TaxID=995038 RepID=A0A1I3DGI7_9MICO|nr:MULTISPECIES: nucleoside hydrolase [Cryobacterium]TFB84723.1 nucleoside hydrolase [Cryobacterium levicorallinum]GEP28490.1 nucleoside hydrolase [Cryobacterium levicorallinum]SFH85892.1 pyrimidine-specific ribonucleoside hydrolase [Cryobacterium levicorallinum]